jgi:hypothetical protein
VVQPFEDDRGIEAAGVGEDYFFNVAHGISSDSRGIMVSRPGSPGRRSN